MKILQIIPSLEMGGAETMCEELSRCLVRQGQQVVLASLFTKETIITRRLVQAGIPVHFLDKKPGLDLGVIPRLRKLLRSEKPDVIHVHLYILKYVGLAALGLHIPIVHTIHNIAEHDAAGDGAINRYFYRTGRAVPVSLSRLIQRTVVDYYGISEADSPVIFNGIDLTRCIPKTDYTLQDPPELIHVGRFWEQKNHDCMIRAVKLLHDQGWPVQLRCFGEGSLLESTQALARKLGIAEAIHCEGVTEQVFPHLNRADIFILPSKWEGMPMTILEAMGTGLPIVASNVGGIADMLNNGYSGLLIVPEPEALAQAVATLLESADQRARLGTNALAEVYRFSSDTMARSYLTLYRQRCEQ